MLIGILSDAHGNPHGFEPCLSYLLKRGVEQLYYLGDSVGYMPDSPPILNALATYNAICLRGNHEQMLLGRQELSADRDEIYRLSRFRIRLGPDHIEQIGNWGESLEVQTGNSRLAFFHGSPWNHCNGYIYPNSDLSTFASTGYDAVFLGHTHRPFSTWAGTTQVINVGSCGMPRDQGDMASCVIYDTATGHAEIVRIPFDAARVLADFGAYIHPMVVDCLGRRSPPPVIGSLLEENPA